ncbi:hypothetical protein DL93DRAFT_2082394 [Clavulina sp. PMI_390]|nr:hypothetical protein DL93DRAFT_2082394 [Clavulina sp. PMI_390]
MQAVPSLKRQKNGCGGSCRSSLFPTRRLVSNPPLMRSFIALATAALCSASLAFAAPLEARVDTKHGSKYCEGTWNNGSKYYCGDIRLGPVKLPKKLPLSGILEEYNRLGGLTPAQYLAAWWNATAGYWNYPPQNGFQLDIASTPILGQQALPVGLLIDRFGSEYGTFLAPADAPYSQRALPPQNLDTPTTGTAYPYNYHVYKVINSFVVASGPIAPWFGQPGQGVQYASNTSVLNLIAAGNIERMNLTDATSMAVLERDLESQRLRRRRALEFGTSA